jgi:hypothetical protein
MLISDMDYACGKNMKRNLGSFTPFLIENAHFKGKNKIENEIKIKN